MRQAMKRWDVGPVLLEGTGSASPELAYGRVLAVDGRRYRIQSESGNCVVDRAVSCLVEPVAGDTVLVASDPAGNGFILAVLQREATGEAPTRLLLDGPASLEVRDGSLAVTADRDLTLAAGRRLGCVAADVSVRADRGSVRVTRMSMAGRVLRSTIQRVRSVALDVDAVCRRMTQRLGDSFRYVSDHDETQAGTQRVLVEETATLHSKNTLIVSEEHVVVNAEQIHLG
jgi:hypothetical protein